jgi:hypothetical protein
MAFTSVANSSNAPRLSKGAFCKTVIDVSRLLLLLLQSVALLQWTCPTELYGIGKYAAGAQASSQSIGKAEMQHPHTACIYVRLSH